MNGNRIEPYVSNHSVARLLPHAVAAQRYLGFTAFPSVLRNVQDNERDLGAVACNPVNGTTLPNLESR